MRTETAVRQYWETSRAWRGRSLDNRILTTEEFFEVLRPLEIHSSFPLARQASELSHMIVKFKKSRCPKPKRKLHNLIQLPTRTQQKTKAA